MAELTIRRSIWGWTLYESGEGTQERIVASANNPGELVELALQLDSNVMVFRNNDDLEESE